MKIAPVSIQLERVTGKVSNLAEKVSTRDDQGDSATMWAAADIMLRIWAATVEPRGYDEVDFEIVYADGYSYKGNIELYNPDTQKTPLLGAHIRTQCLFYSGRKRPEHMSQDTYTKYLAMIQPSRRAEYVQMLDIYEIGGE